MLPPVLHPVAAVLGLAVARLLDGDGEQQLSCAVLHLAPLPRINDILIETTIEIYAVALLRLGHLHEARPYAEQLLEQGWDRQPFLELCREHSLAAGCGNAE